MINELFGYGIINYFIGVLMGVLDAWNKKLMFFIIIIGTVLLVIGAIIIGPGNIFSDSSPWWLFIYNVFFVVLGIWSGKIIYEGIFE